MTNIWSCFLRLYNVRLTWYKPQTTALRKVLLRPENLIQSVGGSQASSFVNLPHISNWKWRAFSKASKIHPMLDSRFLRQC